MNLYIFSLMLTPSFLFWGMLRYRVFQRKFYTLTSAAQALTSGSALHSDPARDLTGTSSGMLRRQIRRDLVSILPMDR